MATSPTRIHRRTCSLCEAMCGLEMEVRGDQVIRTRGNPDDVWSHGYLCPKGARLADLHHDPDRLRAPLVRDGAGFREVSWPEAYAEVARLLAPILASDGARSVAAYIGNPTAHNISLSMYVGAFVALAGVGHIYSAGTMDQWPKNLCGALLYGGMWTIAVPDVDRSDYLLMLGANPAASQGSLLAAADVMGRLAKLRARGGRLVVVDPRRSETAAEADEWLPIRPGGDAALLLAIAHVLFAEGRVQLRHLAGRVDGIEEVRAEVADFSPEAVADFTGVPADTIRRLARELAAAPRAAVYGRIGTCTQEFGSLASWAVDVLNVLTGNLDREGGAMFAEPVALPLAGLRPPEFASGFELGRYRSRVRGAPEVLGQFPISCLAEEIATPGPGRIRALVTIAGNPVLSAADAGRLDAALPSLECMVSIDNWLNETTRHAHVILPGLSPLEQPQYDSLIWMWSVRNAAKYSEPLFPPPADRPREWQTLLMLSAILKGASPAAISFEALDSLYFGGLVAALCALPGSPIAGRDPAPIVAATKGEGTERLLDFTLRIGPHGEGYGRNPQGLSLDVLRAHPNGLDFGPLRPCLDRLLATPSGRVELAPPYLLGDLPRLRAALRRAASELVLVSRRHLRSNNSWMHNVPALVSGRDRCTLLIHPRDAESRGVRHGGRARVRSKAGEIEVPVEVSDEMMPGVVSLPHGWGHDKPGTKLGVARAHAGVCSNQLAPGELVDAASGNQVVNGIPVEVAAA